MNENTEKLIRELADKLGTTAEHLWEILIRQAPISALTDTIVFGLSIAILPFACWLLLKFMEKLDEEFHYFIAVILTGTASVACLIVIIGYIMTLSVTIAGFANPEYWALKQIIK